MLFLFLFAAAMQNAASGQPARDAFAPLTVYGGTWTVKRRRHEKEIHARQAF